jgi:hypothetical protein
MLHANSPPLDCIKVPPLQSHYGESGNRILIHATAALIQLPDKLLRTVLRREFYHKTLGMQDPKTKCKHTELYGTMVRYQHGHFFLCELTGGEPAQGVEADAG